jgi:hypothetical protein
MRLLTLSNHKTIKGRARNWETAILHLAPADLSGRNVCPNATAGCKAGCLNTAGRGTFGSVQAARLRRTLLLLENRREFLRLLHGDIDRQVRRNQPRGINTAVRLNGTSDLPWEYYEHQGRSLMEWFPDVSFYDYTKSVRRARHHLNGGMPDNYTLVLSRSEKNERQCRQHLDDGGNVAVVFHGTLPDKWHSHKVIDGDRDDLRFLDPRGVVVGLSAKGRARKDDTGFVVD